jgi:hypothetical protein
MGDTCLYRQPSGRHGREREGEREREDMVILGQWQRAVHAFPTEYPLTVGEDSRGGKCCLPLPMADKGEEPRPEKN